MASEQQARATLYWLNDSRAQRFVWLLEELGLPYDIRTFQRDADGRAPPELKKIHPLGKAPILSVALPDPADPSKQKTKQVVLAESGFMAQFLCDHFGKTRAEPLLPKRYLEGQEGQPGGETEEWMRCQYYLHYAEGSLMPVNLIAIILDLLRGPRIPFFIRPLTSFIVKNLHAAFIGPEFATHLAFLESQLETSPGNGNYLCGAHLTAADILLTFPLMLVREKSTELSGGEGLGKLSDNYPKVWAYLKRLEEEPGYKRAVARVEALAKKN